MVRETLVRVPLSTRDSPTVPNVLLMKFYSSTFDLIPFRPCSKKRKLALRLMNAFRDK